MILKSSFRLGSVVANCAAALRCGNAEEVARSLPTLQEWGSSGERHAIGYLWDELGSGFLAATKNAADAVLLRPSVQRKPYVLGKATPSRVAAAAPVSYARGRSLTATGRLLISDAARGRTTCN